MTRANDPFEEFLRKKKVEMLEDQYREDEEPHPEMGEAESLEDGWAKPAPGDDDLERDDLLGLEVERGLGQALCALSGVLGFTHCRRPRSGRSR